MARIKVMTWNILYKEKADNVIAFAKEINPDILCCQEITEVTDESTINPGRNIPLELSQALGGDYKYFAVIPRVAGQPASMGNAVISKFPIVSSRSGLVREGGDDVTAGAQNRGYLEVDIQVSGQILKVGTTHLSYVNGFSI